MCCDGRHRVETWACFGNAYGSPFQAMEADMPARRRITKAPAKRSTGPFISRHLLRCLRLSKGWSQREAAELIHMSESGYRKIEGGQAEASRHRWAALCVAAGVPETWRPEPDFEDRILRELGMI